MRFRRLFKAEPEPPIGSVIHVIEEQDDLSDLESRWARRTRGPDGLWRCDLCLRQGGHEPYEQFFRSSRPFLLEREPHEWEMLWAT